MSPQIQSLRIPLIVDGLVILALAFQWGSNMQRMDQMERQILELKSGQISDGRIVAIERDVRYLTKQLDETNSMLRALLDKQGAARK
ncbi:MAG: hypothetical protein ONB55_22310 [candidate division KSB1 bacterium]|nr:hypothetical protein [candidate division KSB1 bacterium]